MNVRFLEAVFAEIPENKINTFKVQAARQAYMETCLAEGKVATEEGISAHLAEQGLIATEETITKADVVSDVITALVTSTAPQTKEAAGLIANANAAVPKKSRGKKEAAPTSETEAAPTSA